MTRDRTHYVGDDCQPAHSELPPLPPKWSAPLTDDRPGPQVADGDREALGLALGSALEDLDRVDAGWAEWHACASPPAPAGAPCQRGLPCPCAGAPFAAPAVVDAAWSWAFRPGGVVARATAAELDRLAGTTLGAAWPGAAAAFRALAAEWREGRR